MPFESPDENLGELLVRSKAGVSDAEIDKIIGTHLIERANLRMAEGDAYFEARSEALVSLVSNAMGKEAIRHDDTSGEGDLAACVDESEDAPESLFDLAGIS